MSDSTQTIGRYRVVKELGRGMMGVVYLAHDPDLGRDIALKVIQYPGGATKEDQESYEERFFAEARSAARLNHPNILVVHDVSRDTASGSPFMALQFVPGVTLEKLLKERKRLDPQEAVKIARGVAEALHHAHSQGVVHRDIKPANIMILPSGDPMIMDFGIAKMETSRMTATGQFVGTPLYMSPEQAMVQPVDGRSDIFSVGSVLYEMLTGIPAFQGESITKILLQLIHQEPAPPSTVVDSVPAFIDHVITRCLAKDPSHRYQSAQDLADDLRDILEIKPPRSLATASNPLSPLVSTSPQNKPGWIARTLSDQEVSSWTTETFAIPRSRPKDLPPRPDRTLEIAVTLGVVALLAIFWMVVNLSKDAPLTALPPPIALIATPTPLADTTPSPSPLVPAEVTVEFEHGLKSGILRIFVDDEAVSRTNLGAKVTRRIIGIPFRKGRVTENIEVPPGKHTIRVQVNWDDEIKVEETETTFKAGGRLRLKAKLGGLAGIRKNLSLEWQ